MSVNYLNNPWKPKPYSVFKDEKLSEHIYEHGYKVGEALPAEVVGALQSLFRETHNFDGNNEGGMFYSVYSQDLNYRRKIHEDITAILAPFFDTHFTNHRIMLSSFVVKVSGPNSEFYLHQDTTGMDEWKHSPMSLWIPLQDVAEDSGCLGIIPKSQHFFSPYRSISFPAPFDSIQDTVRQFVRPLPMRKGEVLFFDNRMIHNSYINNSNKVRVAVICGIFPNDATMLTYHKEEYVCGGSVEIIEQDDDFLFTYPHFLVDCQKRPHVGKSLGFIEDPYQEINHKEFKELCKIHDIEQQYDQAVIGNVSCQMISEPKPMLQENPTAEPTLNEEKKRGFFTRLTKSLGL